MDEVIIATQVMFVLGLVGFGVWFSRLSFQLSQALDDISHSDDQLEEIREMITQVATVLNHLPELMPQFALNNSPTDFLKPLIESFAQKLMGESPLKTVEAPRGMDGRYNGTQTEESNTPTPSETDASGSSRP